MEIKIFNKKEDIKNIFEFWDVHCTYSFSDPKYFRIILSEKSNFIKPYLVVFSEKNQIITLFIGQIVTTEFNFKIGYKKLFTFKQKTLEILYGGMLGKLDHPTIKEFVRKIKNGLKVESIDSVVLKYLDINSSVYRDIKDAARYNLKNFIKLLNPHYLLELPESYEKFLESRSKSVKYNIKRYTNRLEKEYGKRIEIILFQHIQDMDRVIKDVVSISRQTYQFGIGVGISDNAETRKTFAYEFDAGRIRTWIMYLDNEPIAFWIGILNGKTFLSFSTGYLREFSDIRPGMYLNMEIIKYLCICKEVEFLDFGFGYADYKKNYSNILINEEAHFTIYNTKPRGILLFVLQNISNFINASGKNLLHKFDLLNFVKKTWRRKITKSDQK